MKKKGIQLGQAFGAVLALVLIAILVIIAIYLFTSLGSSFTGTASGSVINETAAWVNGSGYTLKAATTNCSFASPSITTVTNWTTGAIIASGNYTLIGNVLYNKTAMIWNDTYVSYSYTHGGQACVASEAMVTNFSGYPTLVGLVGTIIFLALVIGVLVSAFAFGGRRGM